MHFIEKPGRMPFDIDSEASSYKCQVKELAGKKTHMWAAKLHMFQMGKSK